MTMVTRSTFIGHSAASRVRNALNDVGDDLAVARKVDSSELLAPTPTSPSRSASHSLTEEGAALSCPAHPPSPMRGRVAGGAPLSKSGRLGAVEPRSDGTIDTHHFVARMAVARKALKQPYQASDDDGACQRKLKEVAPDPFDGPRQSR